MKKLVWAIIIIAFAFYAAMVWGWIQEGNQRIERSLNIKEMEMQQ